MGLGITSDTLWLAEFSPARKGWKACELGCGTGEISLRVAQRASMHITGIDIDAEALTAARSRVFRAALRVGSRIDFLELSISEAPQTLGRFSFDLVLCNPPFFRRGAGRPSPDPARRLAREEAGTTLAEIVGAASALLKPKGLFCCILPPDRLIEVMALGIPHGLPVTHVQPVHPNPAKPAKRLLIRAEKGSRAALVMMPPVTGGT